MLLLSRKKNESIVINDDITIVVVEIRGDKVRLGVEADASISVDRREVYEAKIRDNQMGRCVPGWPGYRMTKEGDVYSCRDTGGMLGSTWTKRTPIIDKDGYKVLSLHHGGRCSNVRIHRLILIMYGPTQPPGPSMALHNDGNNQNNSLENLRWGFAKDNSDDSEKHGTTRPGDTNGNAVLSWDQVNEIRLERDLENTPLAKLAEKHGVSKKAILNIVHWRTWKKHPSKSEDEVRDEYELLLEKHQADAV